MLSKLTPLLHYGLYNSPYMGGLEKLRPEDRTRMWLLRDRTTQKEKPLLGQCEAFFMGGMRRLGSPCEQNG